MEKKLEVKNLQISFRTQAGILKAVRNISFDLYKGETLAIVGESGSGKSVTNRAIMGISASNSIIEGGEILYDGQDLCRIDEEDFHKLRGDKIAMIFQDPMSSLNPIMKVGRQLTEAMILKAKSGKRNSRKAFNSLLEKLFYSIDSANWQKPQYKVKHNKKMCDTFNSFCVKSNKIESVYNEAYGKTVELQSSIEDAIFMIQRNPKFDYRKATSSILSHIKRCYNRFIFMADNEELIECKKALSSLLKNKKTPKEEYIPALTQFLKFIEKSLSQKAPNFFRLGYYLLRNKKIDYSKYTIDELDKMTRVYLDDEFMIDFIDLAKSGVTYSHNKSIKKKKTLYNELLKAKKYFSTNSFKKSESKKLCKELSLRVKNCIDPLEIKKNSTEYTFGTSLKSALHSYFEGIKQNPIEAKKYKKNEKKYNKLIEKGKLPDWVLKPQVVVDIDLKLFNIRKIINDLIASLENDFALHEKYNAEAKVIEMIDFFKEQASKVVVKMNKSIAKEKAIKLLNEVGIPEPRMRFNQYPFELSGGMRQRIVIAIALSANPDILICDEPTTALDVTIQSQILELINKIKEERHLSVIFITHNLGVVANMADRIAVMYAGKIVEYGTSEEIFYSPAHPYTWALLSSMPDLNTKDKLDAIPGTPPNLIYPPKGDAFAPRNKYALDIDFELQPPLFEITPTHSAATWLLHPNAPKVEMPKVIRERIERIKKQIEADKASKARK